MAFRDYIVHNFWWKLLSLLVAALTWLTINTAFKKDETLRQSPVVTGPSTRSFSAVPVTLLTSASNAGRFNVTPQVVAIEVSGKTNDLAQLQLQDIKAFVDLSEAEDEKKLRKTIQVHVPRDLKAIATPATASVERISNPINRNANDEK